MKKLAIKALINTTAGVGTKKIQLPDRTVYRQGMERCTGSHGHRECRLFGANTHAHHFVLSVPPTAREPLWTAVTGVTAFQNAVILKPDIRLEQPLECGGPRGCPAPLWIAAQPLWFLNVEPSQESGSTAIQSGDDPPHSKSHRTRRSLGHSPSGPSRRVPLVSQLDLAAPSS